MGQFGIYPPTQLVCTLSHTIFHLQNVHHRLRPWKLAPAHKRSGKIHENDDDDQVINDSEHHTKAAKLIQKSLGQTSKLDTFDKLRAVMKGKMHKRQKSTRHEQQYQEICAKFNTVDYHKDLM